MSDADKEKLHKPSGHVRHDPGGRAVWQWAMESGRHAIESTSLLLKKLDLSHLRLLDDDEKPDDKANDAQHESGTPKSAIGSGTEDDPLAGGRSGFNPYDTRTPTSRRAPSQKPSAPPRPRITQPPRPAPEKKPGFLARLFGSGKK